MLRQRPTRRVAKEGVVDTNTGMREGTNFTVANVGVNGKIYLKCVSKSPPWRRRIGDATLGPDEMDELANRLGGPDQQFARPTGSLWCHRSLFPQPPRPKMSRGEKLPKARRTIHCAMGNGRTPKFPGRPPAIGGNHRPSGEMDDRPPPRNG